MSKKVFLGVGHGGNDPGATGYVKEADVNLIMATACKELLEANGVTVKMSRTVDENDPLSEEIKECNAFNPDLAVDVHNNAGGGDGFEVFYHHKGGTGKTLATNIEAEVKKLGQNSRGLKTKLNKDGNDYFGFIRSIKCPSVIVEGIFVDNANDVKIADTVAEQKAFGYAYARGILKTLGIEEKKAPTVTVAPTVTLTAKKSVNEIAKEVLAGKWGNGSDRKARLEKAGYNYSEVQGVVNQLAKGTTSAPAKKSVDEIAREVIKGKWGVGLTRKRNIEKAGYNYRDVQNRVNQLLKGLG